MIDWIYNKETLIDLIQVQKKSYSEIGRMFGCSGNNIKKVAKKLGIGLEKRRKINENETFNKGKCKKRYCLNCGKELNRGEKFCSNTCQAEYHYKIKIEKWLNGENFQSGIGQTPKFIKRYMMELHNNCCEKCGWNEMNIYSKTIPLEIHHKDGDCTNNLIENLELLCPNCHSLTENFGSLNKESKRFFRKKITK